MKKAMYLCLMVAVMPFVSCSSDDDNNGQDPIIGKWILTASEDTEDGEIISEPLTDCEKKSTIEFKAGGTLTSEFFAMDVEECVSEGVESLLWENNGNGEYATSDSEGEEYYPVKVTFSGNTFTSTEVEEYNGKTYVYKETYTKVN